MPRIYIFESRKHKQESFLTIGLNQTPNLRLAGQKQSQRVVFYGVAISKSS